MSQNLCAGSPVGRLWVGYYAPNPQDQQEGEETQLNYAAIEGQCLSRWPVLWWYLLCLACPPSPLGAGGPTYSVLPVCHATGTAFMQLNSLFSCDTARIVWTLPLIVGGTQPCHFLCCAILILPVLVVDHSFGLLQCQEAVTFCLDITPVCWWHTALPFFVPCQAAVHQILLLVDK